MLDEQLMNGFPPTKNAQVTLDNWRIPPFNRWAFQHVRELVPSGEISRGDGPVWQLDRNPVNLMQTGFTTSAGIETDVQGFLEATQADGFLVMHNAKIVTEHYTNDFTAACPHILMSVSKSLTATLAGLFVCEDRINTDTRVAEVIPEIKGSAFEDCTLQHILDMTVGVDFSEDYLARDGLITQYREVSGWKPPSPGNVEGDLRSWLGKLRKTGEHGHQFHYVSPCTDLLGWILERLGGRPFHELFSELIWQPMGAEYDAYVTVDRFGAPRTAGGICVTLRDLARFGQMLLQGGNVNGHQIVPAQWIAETQTNLNTSAWKAGSGTEFLPHGGYHNKWWIVGNNHDAYTGIGVYGQWLYIDPTASVVIAVNSSQPLPLDDIVSIDSLSCFNAIVSSLAA
jgi:CubicO group peptidase (beta-lactamase class C family)